MSGWDLRLAFDREDRTYRAGEVVRGTVYARLDDDRGRGVRLRTWWQTHGKGNTDRGEYQETLLFDGEMEAGRTYDVRFELTAPEGPLTYHGRLVNIDHYVEASLDVAWAVDPSIREEYILVPDPERAQVEARALVSSRKITRKDPGCTVPIVVGLVLVMLGLGTMPVPGLFFLFLGIAFMSWRALAGFKLGEVAARLESDIIVPGQLTDVAVGIRPSKDVRINKVEARLRGREISTSGRGSDKRSHKHEIYSAPSLLTGEKTLTGGQLNIVRGRVPVPETDAYTFEASNNKVQWDLRLRVDVPSWPDWVEDYELLLLPAGPEVQGLDALDDAELLDEIHRIEEGSPLPVAVETGEIVVEEGREDEAAVPVKGVFGPPPVPDGSAAVEEPEVLPELDERAPDEWEAVEDEPDEWELYEPEVGVQEPPPLEEEPEREKAAAPAREASPPQDRAGTSPIVAAVGAILEADRFGPHRRPLIQELEGSRFAFTVTVERVEKTFGSKGGPDYRRGRTIRGTLEDTELEVVALFPETRNDEIEALNRGDRVPVQGTVLEWKGLQERPMVRAEG